MVDITMSLNDTLELDTIIERSSRASDAIGTITYEGSDSTVHNFTGIQTHTGIFDPQESGIYTIPVNGQELKIKVTDPNTIPENGIIHNWLINNGSGKTINDNVGSNDGDSKGCSWTSNTNISNFALSLDGSSNNWIDYGFGTTFNKGTFLFWFNPDSVKSMPLFGNGGTGEQCRTSLQSDGTIVFQRQSSGNSETAVTSSTVSSKNWSMVAAWWDDTQNEIRIYLNGVRDDKSLYSYGEPGRVDGWRFGRQTRNASGENRFVGRYDITSLYDRPLTDSEVERWYLSTQ